MRRNYERTLIPVIRSVKHISTCGESPELNHGAHFWAPSTSPQNWGHLSWLGQSKWPHSNLDRCRCVLFGTGSHTAIPSANKAYLDPLSSTFNLKVEVGNHTQTALIRFQLWSNWPLLREESRRHVKQRCTICVASWKSAICHERNKDSLDKSSRGFQIETASLSHVSGWSWNATPFWQLKIQPRNGVHSVDSLVLCGNTIYSVRGILFNCINPDRITLQQMFFSTIWDISLWSNRRPFLICVLLVKDW